MNNGLSLIRRTGALVAALLAFAAPAFAGPSQQVLDRVFAYDPYTVLNMATNNANPAQDFDLTGITGSDFVTCTLSVVGGLYCLDGTAVRNWPDPLKPLNHSDPVNCNDPALGLDLKKGTNPCTAMTVDLDKTIWIAAKRHNSHSIYKIVDKPAAGCASLAGSGWIAISANTRCAKEMYFGRPPIVDLIAIDGDVAQAFKACPTCATGQTGVIGLEERKATLFFPDPQAAQPVVVVDNKHGWTLHGNELVQDITLLQFPNLSTQVIETTLLATTTDGRILARNTSQSVDARTVFNIPAGRVAGSQKCNSLEQQYGLRASTTTGIVYLSDRNYCQVVALQPTPNNTNFTSLTTVLELDTKYPTPPLVGPQAFPVIGLTIAQGIAVDLTGCQGTENGCALINAPGGAPAASLKGVHVADDKSSVTIFQVKDIPDCRYAYYFPHDAAGDAKRVVCATPANTAPNLVINPDGNGVVVNPNGSLASGSPAAMRLNVTPLLPNIIKKAFKHSGLNANGELPQLLISRQYRGRSKGRYVFEALFVLPEPGIQYVDTFESEFKVPELEGSGARDYCIPGPNSDPYKWDVATRVSELYAGLDGKYVDSLTNVGCNSIRGGLQGMSLLPYDLQVNPDTWNVRHGSYSSTPVQTTNNDAVFARLTESLFNDLGRVQREITCAPAGSSLLPGNVCWTLTQNFNEAKHEMDECIDASFLPIAQRNPEGYDDCQEAMYWLDQFKVTLPAGPLAGDVANRLGELKVRIQVLQHVINDRFLPSIPVGGFCREKYPACAVPPWDIN